MDRNELAHLTETYGGPWGINHTRRILKLIDIIGEGLTYNAEVVWIAAHLHDWGGYPAWAQAGVDHAVRSRQVAEAFLPEHAVEEPLLTPILECIETHHCGDPGRSIEAILLSDADALDFLGVVGILRDFSKKPSDLRKAYETTKSRRDKLPGMLCLPKSQEIARERVKIMDVMLAAFEEETFGCF